MKHVLALLLATILIPVVLGCRSGSTTSAGPGRVPATTQSASAGVLETYRVAEPADLQLSIYGIEPGDEKLTTYGVKPTVNGYVGVVLMLRNISAHDVVVAYGPGSVVVHCGPFMQSGPGRVFGRRREVLDPQALIVFDPPKGGWSELSPEGQPELMIPAKLPPGNYNIWATFEVSGSHGRMIRSDNRVYQAE